MLGMDFTSLCQLSIQTHIIASLQHKINPLFEFFSLCLDRLLRTSRKMAVKTLIFAQRIPLGKNPPQPKKQVFFVAAPQTLCEPKMNIHNPPCLWKTLVDKTVENVENSELSTGILMFWLSPAACGKSAQVFAYPRRRFAIWQITSPFGILFFSSKNLKKVYNS